MPAKAKPKKGPVVKEVTIKVPLGELPEGYERQQADAGKVALGDQRKYVGVQIPPEDARQLLRLRQGLRAGNVELRKTGRRVESNADVIRWILEQLPAES